MISKVSSIIHMLICQFMERVLKEKQGQVHEEVKQATLIFNEELYTRHKWTIEVPINGFASTAPLFVYDYQEVGHDSDELEHPPTKQQVESYMTRIFLRMKLTNEVCLLSLIFIERLMVSP